MIKKEDWIKISIEKIKSVQDDADFIRVYRKKYWLSDDNNNIYFYKSFHSPQCNTNKSICDKTVSKNTNFFTKIIFLEKAYIPFDPDEWCY